MSFSQLKLGEKKPELITAVVEIPRGSRNKYEYNHELDLICLDRVLHSTLFYPTDYGFVPETRSEDADHLDILVLITQPTFAGCVLEVRPVGILDMEDEAGRDWKIIAVADKDPYYQHIQDIDDINIHLRKEIQHFFEAYKHLEAGKKSIVQGWHNKQQAYAIINQAHQNYQDKQ